MTQSKLSDSLPSNLDPSDIPTASEKRKDKLLSPPKYDKSQGRKYGLQPKFIRMRELHLLLFYLCRNFTGKKLTDEEKSALRKKDAERKRLQRLLKTQVPTYEWLKK